jgi:hypothetical protein
MFFVRQTWSKSVESNHEGHEGHKEFAVAALRGEARRRVKMERVLSRAKFDGNNFRGAWV